MASTSPQPQLQQSTALALVALQPSASPYDDALLQDFKTDVRTWLELDSTIKRLQSALKDRREAKRQLTERILQFMAEHNIEDLNTKDGRLRYKVTYVRAPLTHVAIRDKLFAYFESNQNAAESLVSVLFGQRERKERSCLRRLRNA
jgi:hypothetical protein